MIESPIPAFSHAMLYQRGLATLIASWEAYAQAAPGAEVRRLPGVIAAIFPSGPERAVYNDALLANGLSASECDAALAMMAGAYAEAGVTQYAAWVQEPDTAMRQELDRRGYTLESSTLAMGMVLSDLRRPPPELDAATLTWGDYLQQFGLPPGLLENGDLSRFHLRVARLEGKAVAATLAFDHDGDCGIYNVETLEHARRRGLGSGLTLLQLHDAVARGCQTASLQATPIAEGVYAALGFRDLGKILEYVPGALG